MNKAQLYSDCAFRLIQLFIERWLNMNKKSDNISHGTLFAGLNPLKASQPSDTAKIRTDIEETN